MRGVLDINTFKISQKASHEHGEHGIRITNDVATLTIKISAKKYGVLIRRDKQPTPSSIDITLLNNSNPSPHHGKLTGPTRYGKDYRTQQ
jgi:hypothetical protein